MGAESGATLVKNRCGSAHLFLTKLVNWRCTQWLSDVTLQWRPEPNLNQPRTSPESDQNQHLVLSGGRRYRRRVYLLSAAVWEWTWWLLTGWDGLSISKDPEETKKKKTGSWKYLSSSQVSEGARARHESSAGRLWLRTTQLEMFLVLRAGLFLLNSRKPLNPSGRYVSHKVSFLLLNHTVSDQSTESWHWFWFQHVRWYQRHLRFWCQYQNITIRSYNSSEGLTSLQDLGDAGVVGLQLHLKLGQLLVQFAQVPVHLTGRDRTSLSSGRWRRRTTIFKGSFCLINDHRGHLNCSYWSVGELKTLSCWSDTWSSGQINTVTSLTDWSRVSPHCVVCDCPLVAVAVNYSHTAPVNDVTLSGEWTGSISSYWSCDWSWTAAAASLTALTSCTEQFVM